MKTLMNFFAVGLAGSLSVGVFNTRADLEVSASVQIHARADFYAPLETHGAWIEVGSYGRCWRPARVAVEWRPYCYGHWVWTDCGWYWASDEPWGWACYHYGSWVYDPVHAWIWVPDIEWGPAWVSWRVGGGYTGWAPLPPRHVTVTVGAPLFVFVETTRFHEPVRPTTVVVNNTTIINKTTVINNVRRETRNVGGAAPQKVVVNEGPGLAAVEKATSQKLKPVPIQEAARQTPVPANLPSRGAESKTKEKQPVSPTEQPKTAPQQKVAPNEKPAAPTPPPVSDQHNRPGKEKPVVSPSKQPTPAPEHRPPPAENPSAPSKTAPGKDHPNKDQPPSKKEVIPAPEPAPIPNAPPPGPGQPPKEKREGKGHEKPDKGHGNDKI